MFTAVEAGAVACIWAFFVTMFIYLDYRWRDLPELIHRTMRTVAMVMTLIAFASSVGYVMALMQVPARVTALLLTLSSDKNVILLLINVLLLVLGCLLDMAPSILIVTPILLPVVLVVGYLARQSPAPAASLLRALLIDPQAKGMMKAAAARVAEARHCAPGAGAAVKYTVAP